MTKKRVGQLQMIDYIASKKMLRIERWRDGSKSWRVGIEWYGEDDFEFVCEDSTLIDCLKRIIDYIEIDSRVV